MTTRLFPGLFLVLGLALASCYAPQLPAVPFLCNKGFPDCPDGYACDMDPKHCTAGGICNCVIPCSDGIPCPTGFTCALPCTGGGTCAAKPCPTGGLACNCS